jgi:signal peptidase I
MTEAASEAQPNPWEANLPSWRKSFNSFAENWIFAFIIAMAVRHFALEAFRIPTASMEPMLYGDPGFTQSDHVVVDKFMFRFTGASRWDVTVFQFPLPEVDASGEAISALDANGERMDTPFINPLMYRNFVKRAVIVPGDIFYIANGDIFLKQPDGKFQVSRKPPEVQEAVWEEIYRHGAQADYRPWKAVGGAGVGLKGENLSFSLSETGPIAFDQPLRNLYVKPGKVGVLSLPNPLSYDDRRPGQTVDVSMVRPQFQYQDGRTGNIWWLDSWALWRMTSADVKNQAPGTQINKVMGEFVGDLRLRADIVSLTNTAVLRLSEGRVNLIELRLGLLGWQLESGGQAVARGSETVLGKSLTCMNLDDQFVVAIDGKELCRVDVAAADPNKDRTRIEWSGTGTIEFSSLAFDRDVHYCQAGFLAPNGFEDYQNAQAELATNIPQLRYRGAKTLREMKQVRAQMRGVPVDQLTKEQEYQRWGYSEKTAITAPPNGWLMMGDNSPMSWDGRGWGWVPSANLRGHALAVVFPFNRFKLIK